MILFVKIQRRCEMITACILTSIFFLLQSKGVINWDLVYICLPVIIVTFVIIAAIIVFLMIKCFEKICDYWERLP